MSRGIVYLIPSLLSDDGINTIPSSVTEAVKKCQVFFAENERTARRFLKLLWKEIVIDDYEWFTIHKAEEELKFTFTTKLREGKTIGIISEAGCPGIADPGQVLVATAQEKGAEIIPLTGPSSILLALMASGMNGQQFRFCGYLPVNASEKEKAIRDLESDSARKLSTQIFIETPYRNNQLFESILKICKPSTRVCLAVNLTGQGQWIRTRSVAQWKQEIPDIHKRPAIFLLYAG